MHSDRLVIVVFKAHMVENGSPVVAEACLLNTRVVADVADISCRTLVVDILNELLHL